MKEIKAYIKKSKLSDVVWALHKIEGQTGLTMSDVFGYGRGKAKNSADQTTISSVAYSPRAKLEIFCDDSLAEEVVNTIQTATHTGLPGDGKIYVSEIDDAVRISTNERGSKGI